MVELDTRPPWTDYVKVLGGYIKAASFGLAALAGRLKRAFWGQWILVVAFTLYSITLLVSGPQQEASRGLSQDKIPLEQLLVFLEGFNAMAYAFFVAFFQKLFITFQAVTAAIFIAIFSVLHTVVLDNRVVLGVSLMGDLMLLGASLLVIFSKLSFRLCACVVSLAVCSCA